MDEENKQQEQAKKENKKYIPEILEKGNTISHTTQVRSSEDNVATETVIECT